MTPPNPTQPTEASEVFALIYTLGISAAALFVKNPAHVQTASNIIAILNAELPILQALLK